MLVFCLTFRATFPGIEALKIQKDKGAVDVVYKGLCKKVVPLPFPSLIGNNYSRN